MNPDAIDTAAHWLVAARRERRQRVRLPESCRPLDSAGGHAIQQRVAQLLGAPIGGWKCSVPSGGREPAAPIYDATIVRGSPCPVPVRDGHARIEPEIAFVLARDLPARGEPYTEQDVVAAIGETRLVLEVLGSRITDPNPLPFPESLADGLVNAGLYVGPALDDGVGRKLDSFVLSIRTPAGLLLQRDAVHPDGHPLRPLVWLANWLGSDKSGWGAGLAQGQIVTTGSYAGAIEVRVDVPLVFGFGDLGRFEVTLEADG